MTDFGDLKVRHHKEGMSLRESDFIANLLAATTPAATVVSMPTALEVLIMVGLVRDKDLVAKLKQIIAFMPVTAPPPATLHGVLKTMSTLAHLSPRAESHHHSMIDASISAYNALPDENLTFGTFIGICKVLLRQRALSESE